jgi:hypothetical protein
LMLDGNARLNLPDSQFHQKVGFTPGSFQDRIQRWDSCISPRPGRTVRGGTVPAGLYLRPRRRPQRPRPHLPE